MKKLQTLDTICRGLGGQCITFDINKKWNLDEAKGFVKAHWPNDVGHGLTVFKFADPDGTPYTTIFFGYFDSMYDNITMDGDNVRVPLKGSYIAYDDYNGELRDFTAGDSLNIFLLPTGGAYLA